MRTFSTVFLALVLGLSAAAPTAGAQDGYGAAEPYGDDYAADYADNGGDPNAIGHSADGYYWDFAPFGALELPRMFLVRRADGSLGFDAFWTTHDVVDDPRYTLTYVGKGTNVPEASYMTTAQLEAAVGGHKYLYFPVAYKPEFGNVLIDFSISRQTLFMFFSALFVLVMGLWMAGRYKKGYGRDRAPRGVLHNMLETVVVFIRDDVARPSIGKKYRRYLPYLLTAFFFILIGNLLGLVPWGVTATSSIMVTGTLALFTFIITQLAGTKDYWAHIFNPPGVPWFVKPILIPVEFLGLFTKPLALAFRLFGNMVSGHLVIVSILGLIFIFAAQLGTGVGLTMAPVSIFLTVFIYVLKIVVSFVQAYIFVMLSAVFIGMAVEEHEHHHEEDHIGGPINMLPHGELADHPAEHRLSDYAEPAAAR